MVTGLQPGDAFPYFLDDPGALVAAHDREAGHDVAVPQVLVGVAQSCGHIPDEYLARLGGIQVELGDLEVLAYPAQYRGLGLH